MNPIRCIKSTGPGIRVLLLAVAWLVLITALHMWRDHVPVRESRQLKVGFMPITCHLLCPVTHARLEGTPQEFLPVKFLSWPDMIDAIRGAEIDMAFILAPIAMALREQGIMIKILLLGHRNGTALVVSRASGIREISQLAGRHVGIPIRFSTQNLELLKLCEQAGISPESMDILELPPPDMPSALASGGIDAYIVGEPYAAQAELAGTGTVLAQMKDVSPGFISSVLVVRESVMKHNSGRVRDLVRAFAAGARWIEKNRVRAAETGAEAYGLSLKLMTYVLTSPEDRVSYTNIIPDHAEIKSIASEMVKRGLITRTPPARDLIDLSWR